MMFRGPPAGGEREFRGPREDAPFRGPFDELRRGEFRGPPGAEFELERRILDERGPEWERGESRYEVALVNSVVFELKACKLK
jgi:hypothetical protein